MLLHEVAIQEGHDLGAGAVVGRAEGGAVAGALGDAVFHSPVRSAGVIGVSLHIGEGVGCADSGRLLSAPQEGDDLAAGADSIWTELTAAGAAGDALLYRPGHGLGVVRVSGDVGEAAYAHGLGAAGCPPQEGDDLGPGAGGIGAEGGVRGAVGDVVFQRPFHGGGVVGIPGHIHKGVIPGEDRLHGDLAVGHLEGKGAVAVVGHGDLIAESVLHNHAARLVVAVRGDGDGHGVALLGAGLGDADAAVIILGNRALYLVGGRGVGGGVGGGGVGGVLVGVGGGAAGGRGKDIGARIYDD